MSTPRFLETWLHNIIRLQWASGVQDIRNLNLTLSLRVQPIDQVKSAAGTRKKLYCIVAILVERHEEQHRNHPSTSNPDNTTNPSDFPTGQPAPSCRNHLATPLSGIPFELSRERNKQTRLTLGRRPHLSEPSK
jgi:hypothetical protein